MIRPGLLAALALLLAGSTNTTAETAVFAGGCFWCMEADFEELEGVSEVISGFTGGKTENPTYEGGHTGHYESIMVNYDPQLVSYEILLDYFWLNIDPFDKYGQFCDKGESYLSAIFVTSAEERRMAEASRQKVVEQFPEKTVITPILERSTFYPIKGDEEHHQDYYKKSPFEYKYYRWRCGRDKRLIDIWGW
ncbi:MAG: peptide-methionine (S)-S-oxide reductase MsrA [Candidatus Sedimenticola sp. 20ELBAFRAG]